MKYLLPSMYVESIYHIDLAKLRARGIDTIISDLDNTLVPWVENKVNPELKQWLENLKAQGFKVCLVSNALERRIAHFRTELNVPGLSRANKPSRKAFRQALALLGSRPETTAMIGDQVFTDVLGGNRLGLFTILVVPLSDRDFFTTRIVRIFERWVLRHMARGKE
ncbi:MAG: YqeG family HAD IIIA-type phosphatase [Selenomonadales bacterium]|nr:YqeG family HAD IIIA-type phosphatase [Selenomonadales bacterium]